MNDENIHKVVEMHIKLVYNKGNAQKVRRKENKMEVMTNLKDGGKIIVRIENGLISEAICQGSTQQQKVARREETAKMECLLKNILNSDVENFKEILTAIKKEDIFFYSYGKELLESEKKARVKKIFAFSREAYNELARLQEDANKYFLPD